MDKEEKLKMHTKSLADEKFSILSKYFPNAITEAKDEEGKLVRAIDADILKQEINTHVVEGREERYQFTWPDKREAMLLANTEVNSTLRPCREESVDFDNTENLYIEGDNLEVLKLLRETYLNRVKIIYIDPPYNTGNDFVYEDDFQEAVKPFLERDGQYDEQWNRLVTNFDSNGRFHTDWLNMMYPRLKIARDLLADDGVLYISIDDSEVENLKKICDEIFGVDNFIGTICRITKKTSDAGKYFAPSKDYVVTYSKKISELSSFREELGAGQIKQYGKSDAKGKYKTVGFYQASLTLERSRHARYFITCPDGTKCIPPEGKRWRCIEPTYLQLLKDNEIEFIQTQTSPLLDEFGNQSKWNVYTKMYLIDRQIIGKTPRDYIDDIPNVLGSKELIELGIPFNFPKPTKLTAHLISILQSAENAVVLDFFSGSSSSAHAVMDLNARDQGKRKFIMVQIPESIDEHQEAFKQGYRNICEIGKERIRRAGVKIKGDNPLTTQNLDIGFRVLKLDSSNMKKVFYTPEEHEQLGFPIDGFADNIKEGRTDEDLLFQVMLELGIPLSASIKKVDKIFYVDHESNFLIACFDRVDTDLLTEIARQKPQYAVFRDHSFASDSDMVNFEQIFATYSPSTVRRIL